jgi:TctA family transporter
VWELFIGMIGMDPITGMMRFTFGSAKLSGGINIRHRHDRPSSE